MSELDTVTAIRAKYPTPLGATHAAFLLEVAPAVGKGLLKKSGGTNVALPDGTRVSIDHVMDRTGLHWDILVDAEGAAVPQWTLTTNPPSVDPNLYYAVADTPPTPGPGPDPTPYAVAVPSLYAYEALNAKVDALEARLAALEQAGSGGFPARIALRSDHGKYVSAQPNGTIVADRDEAAGWETFTVEAK